MNDDDRELHRKAHALITKLIRAIDGKKAQRDPDKHEWVRRQIQLLASSVFLREWDKLKRDLKSYPDQRIRQLEATLNRPGSSDKQRREQGRSLFQDEAAAVRGKSDWIKMSSYFPLKVNQFARRFHITSMNGDVPEIRRARPSSHQKAYCPACSQPIPPQYLNPKRGHPDVPRPLNPYLPCPSCKMEVLKGAIKWVEIKTYEVSPGDYVDREIRKALGRDEADLKRAKIKTSLGDQYGVWYARNVLGKSWSQAAKGGSIRTALSRAHEFERLINN